VFLLVEKITENKGGYKRKYLEFTEMIYTVTIINPIHLKNKNISIYYTTKQKKTKINQNSIWETIRYLYTH